MLAARVFLRRVSSSEKYYFEVMKKSHRNEVVEFLNKSFRLEESLNKASKITESEINTVLGDVMDRVLKNEVSVLARAKGNDELAGCMLSSVWKREDDEKKKEVKQEFEFGGTRIEVATIGEILNELHEDFWKHCPDHHTVLHFEISSVDKNHQRKGLASAFLNWTERKSLLESVNASGIVGEASSIANQILMAKRGYETLATILLNSKVHKSTGKQILVCEDGTDRVNLMFKKF
uniref:aralkylamine N-acetyltransferase n=1 Tax=Caenorhabditis japonica TaxID=281687 RepID=A0A8R1DLC7_CAEJA